MSDEVFRERVYQVRESWAERRQASALTAETSFEAQVEMLRLVYGWAAEALEEIRTVYGDEVPVALGETPNAKDVAPSFSVSIGGAQWATFTVESTQRRTGEAWQVVAAMGTAGGGGTGEAAGRGGRIRRWTRRRLDDLLLTLLGAFERSRTRG